MKPAALLRERLRAPEQSTKGLRKLPMKPTVIAGLESPIKRHQWLMTPTAIETAVGGLNKPT